MRVGYARVSTEEQQRNDTIDNQRAALRRACELRATRIDRLFEDPGVSGTVPLERRTGGRALLEEAKAGRVQELFVNTWDRLGRNLRDFLNVLEKLERLGVKVTCISQPTSDDPAGHLMRHVFGAFAEHERERIVERTMAGFRRKAEGGGYCGGFIPFGYCKQGEAKDARLVLDTNPLPGLRVSSVDIVRRIFRDAAAGKSCQKIADYLNGLGLPPSKQKLRGSIKTGKESIWRPNSVRVILTNPTYTGTRQWGRRSWVRDKDGSPRLQINPREKVISFACPAIADEGLWKRANAVLHENQISAMAYGEKGMARDKTGYLLRTLIRCGICGLKYTGRGTHYACIGRHCARRLYGKTRPPCPAPTVRRDDLERAVWDDIEWFLSKPGAVLRQLEEQMVAVGGKGRRVADDIAALEARRGQLETAEEVALRQLTRGQISETQFDKEVESIKRDKTANEVLLTELRKLSAAQDANAVALDAARSVFEDLREKVHGKLTFEKRRRAVLALVESITVTPVEGQKLPKITFRYRFQPHAERQVQQWSNAESYVPA
jgi:site-specific DNA recombinase